MKKYLKLLFVAIFASMSFAFVACGDDEDDEPDYEIPSKPSDGNNDNDESDNDSNDVTKYNIVGSWESTVVTNIPGLDNSKERSFTRFYEDGTYVGVNIEEGYDNVIVRGTWSIEGNKLTNTTMGMTVTYEIIEYSKNSFKVKFGNNGGYIRWERVDDSVIDRYL